MSSYQYFSEFLVEKRKEEERNITLLKGDNPFRIVMICGISVPCEIIIKIFENIEFGGDAIIKYGRVCKTFYINLLMSWRILRLTKKNVYNVSLLVLGNIRGIVFIVKSQNNVFRKSEFRHISKHIHPEHLSSISIKSDMFSFSEFIGGFVKLPRDVLKPFGNVRKFSWNWDILETYTDRQRFRGLFDITKGSFKVYRRDWAKDIRLRTVFPNLEFASIPTNFEILEGLEKLNKLSIDTGGEYFFEKESIRRHTRRNAITHPLGQIGTPLRDDTLEKTRISTLSLTFFVDDSQRIMKLCDFLNGFENLTNLSIEVLSMDDGHNIIIHGQPTGIKLRNICKKCHNLVTLDLQTNFWTDHNEPQFIFPRANSLKRKERIKKSSYFSHLESITSYIRNDEDRMKDRKKSLPVGCRMQDISFFCALPSLKKLHLGVFMMYDEFLLDAHEDISVRFTSFQDLCLMIYSFFRGNDEYYHILLKISSKREKYRKNLLIINIELSFRYKTGFLGEGYRKVDHTRFIAILDLLEIRLPNIFKKHEREIGAIRFIDRINKTVVDQEFVLSQIFLESLEKNEFGGKFVEDISRGDGIRKQDYRVLSYHFQ